MKKLLLFVSLLALGACTDKSIPESARVDIPAEFSTKTNSFAIDFWKAYEQEKGGTYFLSPLSLNIALGMLLNGTEGETRSEIQQMLGFNNADMATINANYRELLEKLPKVDEKVVNTTANSVWYKKQFSVEKTYTDALKQYFNAGVYAEDFADPATVGKINRWAAQYTQQKIEKVLEQIQDNQVLFLLNALYFKGEWTSKFDEKNTVRQSFYGENKHAIVPFMNTTASFGYTRTETFEMLELPYGNEKYAFIAMLPTHTSADKMITDLTKEQWDAARNALVKQKVDVYLPKFKMESSENLNEVLKSMGMKRAFTNEAELGGISRSHGLFVDFVKQDTFLTVDEKGSEAAAVTTVGVGLTSLPQYPTFKCDKPFAFAIVEKTSDTIQFIGKVNDVE